MVNLVSFMKTKPGESCHLTHAHPGDHLLRHKQTLATTWGCHFVMIRGHNIKKSHIKVIFRGESAIVNFGRWSKLIKRLSCTHYLKYCVYHLVIRAHRRGARYSGQWGILNVESFNHHELWRLLVINSLPMTSQILWPLITTNCGGLWSQIASLRPIKWCGHNAHWLVTGHCHILL